MRRAARIDGVKLSEALQWRCVIYGAPRTKKNHGRIVTVHGYPKLLPSKAFLEWNEVAQATLAIARLSAGLPIRVPVNCCALFYRDAERGDAVGYYQALADALEKGGIVENDRLIVSWDGSRMLKSSSAPRVEVQISRV